MFCLHFSTKQYIMVGCQQNLLRRADAVQHLPLGLTSHGALYTSSKLHPSLALSRSSLRPWLRIINIKAIIDNKLCPRCITHGKYFRSFISEQNLVRISAVMLIVFYRCLEIHKTSHRTITWKHDVIHKTGSTWRIATPSEEDRAVPKATCIKVCWSWAVWFSSYVSGQTNRQLITILRTIAPLPGTPGRSK